MHTPPPKPPVLHREKCGAKHCYSEAEARQLGLWAAAIERWSLDAWEFCRSPDAPESQEKPNG